MGSSVRFPFPLPWQIYGESRQARCTLHISLYFKAEDKAQGLRAFIAKQLYSLLFVSSMGGEALKRLIWETVNRIYANLMIPAITGGSTPHFQAAEILLELLLQSHLVWLLARSHPDTGFLLAGRCLGCLGAEVPPSFGCRMQRELPQHSTMLASSPAATNLPHQPRLLVELRTNLSAWLLPN